MPRFDLGGAHRSGPGAILRSGATGRDARDSGMAQLLFQIADVREGTVSRARFVHSADEAQEHVALDDGRGFDHAFGFRVLRLRGWIAHDLRTRRGASSAVLFCAERAGCEKVRGGQDFDFVAAHFSAPSVSRRGTMAVPPRGTAATKASRLAPQASR